MASPDQAASDRFVAERNSALTIAILQLCAGAAAPPLLWDQAVVSGLRLGLWMAAEFLLALLSFAAYLTIRQQRVERFFMLSRIDSVGTALSFSALPWLGDEIARATPSKYVLMIALIAVSSIAAANSAHIPRRRPSFERLMILVACSYCLAFALHGEWTFTAISAAWCAAITLMTRVGYDGMQELIALRAASDDTARHDGLTGLWSRWAFLEILDRQIEAVDAPDVEAAAAALVLFDLDGFKGVNDAFGHVAGDEVLRTVAKRLSLFLPASSIVGRLGGDEFAAIVHEAEPQLTELVEAALVAVADPIRFDERELYVAASSGWTTIVADTDPAELMAQADAAMYQSKNSQTAVSTGFDGELQGELERSLDLRQRFRSALKRNEIEFWAQPIVRTSDSAPIAVELLARWPQEDSTIVGPLEFARVADETGLTVELDRQAIAAASELLAEWQNDPILRAITVKANISPIHLHNNELIQTVRELVPSRHREWLGLEFVESQLIAAAERNHDQLRQLRDMGITVSIDDFGVGYSSLAYLRTLPVSELKIDRSFVTDVDTDVINQGLVRAIVDMASTLGLPTVAEGVETQAEFEQIEQLGVSSAQGYLLGRPVALSDAAETLQNLQERSTQSTQAVAANPGIWQA